MGVRSPTLHRALRLFCLGAFAVLERELERGGGLPFAFEEHRAPGRPSLYEYRPLVATFVEARARLLEEREDARIAVDELRREPAAAIFSRAHAEGAASADEALFRSVLVPLLTRTAEACGGFDWDDSAFDGAYAELEHSLHGKRRAYGALAPVVGLTIGSAVTLGPLRVRHVATGELAAHWPEAHRLLPRDFGREPDRLSVLEFEQTLSSGASEPPDAPGEIADAVTVIRLATAGPVAAGPVLFERLDWRPLGVRPVLPIAATQPEGEPTRLDPFRGRLAAKLLERLPFVDDDHDLGDALDRWELSLFQRGPARTKHLREALVLLLGGEEGAWAAAVRGAMLLGETGRERADVMAVLLALVRGRRVGTDSEDAVRRALVETIANGDRRKLLGVIDEALLGLRPRPGTALARANAV